MSLCRRTGLTLLLFHTMAFGLTSLALPQSEGVDGHTMLAEYADEIVNINTAELQAKINTDKNIVLIDVRTSAEIDTLGGTIDAGSKNINLNRGWLEFRVGEEVPEINEAR